MCQRCCLEFEIASTIFASQGIVLEIMNVGAYHPFFFCDWWSDYSAEEECLFVAGLQSFIFSSMRNIPQNENYQQYITVTSTLKSMVSGAPIKIRKPKKKDVRYMNKLIQEAELHKT